VPLYIAWIGDSSAVAKRRGRGRWAAGPATNSLSGCAAPINRAVHRVGDERAWWQTIGIDPIRAARTLWKHTRVNQGQIRPDRTAHGADSDRPTKISDGGSKAPA
jgi:hypothetical protein